jgi:hypothetical protein
MCANLIHNHKSFSGKGAWLPPPFGTDIKGDGWNFLLCFTTAKRLE